MAQIRLMFVAIMARFSERTSPLASSGISSMGASVRLSNSISNDGQHKSGSEEREDRIVRERQRLQAYEAKQ